MNRHDSLRAITRRALWIHYVCPNICEGSGIPASGSGAGISAVLDFEPVFRAAGPTLEVAPFSAGKLRLSWTAVPNAFVYVAYRSDSLTGPFTVIASGIQSTFYVDTPDNPGTYYYQVSGIEPNHGETELSNIASGTA